MPTSTGMVICDAKNRQGVGVAKAKLIMSDLDEEMSIWPTQKMPVTTGEAFSITCGVSAHKYTTELNWFKDDIPIIDSDSMMKRDNYFLK